MFNLLGHILEKKTFTSGFTSIEVDNAYSPTETIFQLSGETERKRDRPTYKQTKTDRQTKTERYGEREGGESEITPFCLVHRLVYF